MKKAMAYIIGSAFLISAIAFAADKTVSDTTKTTAVKANPVKTAKMNATGKIIELSDKAIKIERSVKNNVETMEFVLEKPAENVSVNDSVKIAYIEKDGKLIASRVAKILPKKAGKKEAVTEKSAVPKK